MFALNEKLFIYINCGFGWILRNIIDLNPLSNIVNIGITEIGS